MTGGMLVRLLAWAIALTLVALPVVGVLNGWFASERWPVTQLAVRAEFNHVSADQIRAAAAPALGAGFFALRLDAVRDAVARLPWVERVEARKHWPDTVDLVVYEQQPYARWGADRLVNRRGEIFSVAGSSELQGLPRLAGPDERLAEVLAFHAQCQKEFAGSGLTVEAVTLTPRGGWRLELTSGALIELGRDAATERLQRFLDVWPRLARANPQPPAYIDLRYENGFAMRWAAVPPNAGIGDSGSGIGEKPFARFALAESGLPLVGSALFPIPNPHSPIPALP
jgi:cell division protein FtsQ